MNLFKILVTSLLVITTTVVSMKAEANYEFGVSEHAVATLTDENGDTRKIYGVLVKTKRRNFIGMLDEVSNTYMFELYSSQNFELTTNKTDGSYSIKVYLTIDYSSSPNDSDLFLLTRVSGSWENLDRTVSVESSVLTYGCSTLAGSQAGEKRNINKDFSYNTNFSTYIPKLYGIMGANLNLTLVRKNNAGVVSSRWDFRVENMAFNNF